MPTQSELTSLSNAPSTGTTDWNGTGVSGRIFGIAPNQIFLPAGKGWCDGLHGRHHPRGSYSSYWSSTLFDGYIYTTTSRIRAVNVAYGLFVFDWDTSGGTYIDTMYGGNGFLVRCVSK